MNYGNPYGMFGTNTLFPQNYPQQAQIPQQNPSGTEDLFVPSETAAEAYLVAPGCFVRLWDSSKPVFYEKRADASGRQYPMEVFEYTRRSQQAAPAQAAPAVDYGEVIRQLDARIKALEEGVRTDA